VEVIKYEKSNFKAVVKCNFVLSDDDYCIASVDESGEAGVDMACRIGTEMEYFFTRENGDHFVFHEGYSYGFWVASTLVDIKPL
jgi:hypothetical protein